MKICPKCLSEHNKSGTYCSRSCANSRVFTEESKKKRQESNKRYWYQLSEKDKIKQIKILSEASPRSTEKYFKSLFEIAWEDLGIGAKRLRVILEQDGKCNKCNIDNWLGQTITLEYEHKDGNNENNARENVEALCPNCHSQTSTWRGRKNRKNQNFIEKYLKMNKEINT